MGKVTSNNLLEAAHKKNRDVTQIISTYKTYTKFIVTKVKGKKWGMHIASTQLDPHRSNKPYFVKAG